MKRLFLLFCLLSSICAKSQTLPSYVPTNGLVGWWPFNGNANDESGNGNNGTVYNSPTLTADRFGNNNSAYNFDWSNVTGYGASWQKIEIPTIVTSNSFTVNIWIRPTDFCWPNNNIKSAMLIAGSAACSNTSGGIRFGLTGNSGAIGTSTSTGGLVTNTGEVDLNVWQMATLKVNSDSSFIYVNSVLVAKTSLSSPTTINSCLSVGLHHQSNGHWYYYDGDIDDIGIWNRELSSSEIEILYNQGNTEFGNSSLNNTSTGSNNSAFGERSLYTNTTGSFNTASGGNSLSSNTTGSKNTGLGFNVQASSSTSMNQTIIGYEATGQADNSVVLGNDDVTAVYMAEDRGAKIYAGEGDFSGDIVTAGNITVSSDIRLKKDIVNLPSTIDNIKSLRPVSYSKKNSLNSEEYGSKEIGLIAQELQEVYPNMVSEDDSKDPLLSVSYLELIPVLIKAIQEQQVMIERQQKQIESLENVITSKE